MNTPAQSVTEQMRRSYRQTWLAGVLLLIWAAIAWVTWTGKGPQRTILGVMQSAIVVLQLYILVIQYRIRRLLRNRP